MPCDYGHDSMNHLSLAFDLPHGEPMLLSPRQQQIAALLLQGCDNAEIARVLKMNRRTVKAYFNRLFLRFGISDGIKRVKLATLLYRHQLTLEANAVGASGTVTEEARVLHTGALPDPTGSGSFPQPRPWNEAQQNDDGHHR
jgi:DNA-binding CsgD family transcriptional regulator